MKHDSNDPLVSSPQEISELISRYRASDLGLERFAQKHGIPTGRLRYWLYQKHRVPHPSPVVKPSGVALAPLFQEVKLAAGVAPSTGWAAEISLPKGLAIRFSAGATPAWIGSIVQALQRPW